MVDIIGLGMSCLDILIRTADLPTWERGASLSSMAIDGGGPVATALVAAQRLGASTAIQSIYGNDRLGEIKLQTLVEHEIDTSHMIRRPAPENHALLVSVQEGTGDRVFSGMSAPDFKPILPEELEREWVTSGKILHLDGCFPQAALVAAQWMHAAGKPVMLDGAATCGPVSQEMIDLIAHVDILICGAGFVPSLTGKSDIWEAGNTALKLGPRVVIQTNGEKGSYTVSQQESFHTPAFASEVIDTTGAGDVFHGAFLVGILQHWPLREIVLFSTAVAAIKCTRLGGRAGIPTFPQVMKFLQDRGFQIPES